MEKNDYVIIRGKYLCTYWRKIFMILLDENICIFSGQIFKYLSGESRCALIEGNMSVLIGVMSNTETRKTRFNRTSGFYVINQRAIVGKRHESPYLESGYSIIFLF